MNLFTTLSCLSFSLFSLFNVALVYASTDTMATDSTESYWTTGTSMIENRNEITAVLLYDWIFAMGGEDYISDGDGGGTKDTVEVYDIARDEWIANAIAPLPLALHHSASAVYNGKIYVVGGFLDEKKAPTDKLFIYDPEINEWQEGRSLPTPIAAATNAEFVNDILYVIGGVNASLVPVDTNFAYDPKTDTWSTKAPMPTARHHLQTAVVDGKIFALGGRILGDGVPAEDISHRLSTFDRNEMYDPQTDSWTILEPMLTKRSGFAAAAPSDGNIYVFGGEVVDDVTDTVEKYDPISNKWTFEKSMPVKRVGIDAVPFNDRIYVLGGVNLDSMTPLNLNEIFHIDKQESND